MPKQLSAYMRICAASAPPFNAYWMYDPVARRGPEPRGTEMQQAGNIHQEAVIIHDHLNWECDEDLLLPGLFFGRRTRA